MDKKKQGLLGGGILVLALIAAVGIVYAAYSQTLSINGTAAAKANSWKVKFVNLSDKIVVGDATVVTAPTISSDETKIGDFSILLSKPGSSVTYNFDIKNEGTFDAVALESSITGLTPTCTATTGGSETDANNVCDYLTYEWIIPESAVSNGEIKLNAGSTLSGFGIKLTYKADVPADKLPQNDVAISGLNTSILFKQAE